VEGLLLSTTIRQTYRNDTSKNLEVVYTFPLAWDTTLLGLDAVVGGKRLAGTVTPKDAAERDYEKAVEEGDLPVMVQESASGLMTANLGNVKPGETVELALRCGQFLRIEQEEVRICIPTVLAPRYGNAHGQRRVAGHESDAVARSAAYPLGIHIDVPGDMARASIECPTHKVSIAGIEGGMAVDMEGGHLDRDFVLLLRKLPAASFAMSCEDGKEIMLVAGFCPKFAQVEAPLLLKMLVDCSGSMSGDSIAEARIALRGVLQQLREGDHVSYSRFGDSVRHRMQAMQPCSKTLRKELANAVNRTDALNEGTEMAAALASTIRDVASPAGTELAPCILLITDDLVWDESMLETAETSGHRIFAIGVGSAPAQATLRRMAERTGGACVFVPPNEDVGRAVTSMFRRMRGPRPPSMRVEWGGTPSWASNLPASVFDGDTVHVFASFPMEPEGVPRLVWEQDGKTREVAPETVVATDNPDVRRLGGLQKAISAGTPDEAARIALEYRLVTEWTSLFLVHVRNDAEKTEGLPTLHQVPNMLAAGTHGVGSVIDGSTCHFYRPSEPRYLRAFPGGSAHGRIMFYQPPSHRYRDIDWAPTPPTWHDATVKTLARLALHATDLEAILDEVVANLSEIGAQELVKKLAKLSGQPETILWAVFLQWLMDAEGIPETAQRHSRRLLKAALAGIDEDVLTALRLQVELNVQNLETETLRKLLRPNRSARRRAFA
jgi:Ca-activated chloride channel family protein